MSNQIVISSGAKVRSLEGVLTGTAGIVNALGINVANGIPQLDGSGKILVSQLPNSVMEYKGTWNAATNTPTLVNGTGNQGDVYLCNVAGTTDFGAGPITFFVGDQVIYSGTIWQRASGATGTVTSVAVTESGDALTITGSPITTSGTINIGFAGVSGQYINGAGGLTTFPTLISSIGLSMPSAFSVANSPLTANGTIAVTGAGVASQYIRGDGTLANFPTSGGGGGSVSYYLNGSVNQGTFGGNTYYEMGKVPVIGAGTDFTINADGYISQFITDAGDPALLEIPAGNWNFEMYFSASSGGGTPSFYVELYKYNGSAFTLISSSSATPEGITGGTAIDLYTTALAVPTTALTLTDRLAVRVYVTHSGRTITLHTENSHLCQVITTFSTGITALNGLTAQVQFLATGTSGTDFNISSTTATHTFNIPDASATARGLITTGTQTIAGLKTFSSAIKADSGIRLKDGVATGGIGYVGIGSNAGQGLTLGIYNSGTVYYQDLFFPITNGYQYTFPAATGTLALTSDISYPVTSVFGRTGAVVATEGDYSLTQLSDVTITSPTNGQVLKYNGTAWVNDTDANTGTVTSVDMSVPTGLSVSGNPITTSGTLAVTFASGYSIPTNVKQSNWDDAYTFVSAFPTQTGNAGKYLTTNGSSLSWADNPLGTVTSVGLSSATSGVTIGSSPITTSGTITLSIATASGSQNGLLSSTDWTTFNNKANALSGTINTIAYWDSATTIASLALATYPSLTELSYVKGVTSAIQTQLNGKQGTLTLTTTGTSGAATLVGDTLNIPQYSGGGGGSISLAAIGSTPNANAATLTGTVLNLEPASASFGGVVTTGTQTFAGAKTFNSSVRTTDRYLWGTATNGTTGQIVTDNTNNFFDYLGILSIRAAASSATRITILESGNTAFGSTTATSRLSVGNKLLMWDATPTGASASTEMGYLFNTTSQPAGSFVESAGAGTGTILSYGTNVPQVGTRNTTFVGGIFRIDTRAAEQKFVVFGYPTGGSVDTERISVNLQNGNTILAPIAGNVGIGLSQFTTMGSKLQINGNAAIGYSASTAAPSNGLVVAGQVGIGTSSVTAGYTLNVSGLGRMVGANVIMNYGELDANNNFIQSINVAGNAARGFVFFGTAELMRLTNTGNLGIFTTTIGSRLQVNGNVAIGYSASTAAPNNGLAVAGTSTFNDAVTITKNQNAATTLTVSNSTAGASSNVYGAFSSNGGSFFIGKNSTTTSATKIIAANDAWLYNITVGDIAILNDNSTGAIKFAAGGSSTAQLTIASTGAATFSSSATATSFIPSGSSVPTNGMYLSAANTLNFATNTTNRLTITSGGIINTTSRLNVNGAGDNSLFSLNNNGTTYTVGFSPTATASSATTLTITSAATTWIYNGIGAATWTLPDPSGTNQMFWFKNAGTGIITLNAFAGTNIINNTATPVTSITIAVGATAVIQQDGNVRSYQLQ